MRKLVCTQDFEDAALAKLDKNARDYVKSGSDDEVTLRRNKDSYNNWLIRPRMLRDVSRRNLKKVVQGKIVEFPIGFSPVGFQGIVNPEGEVLPAKGKLISPIFVAAASMGTIYVHSTYASRSIEDIGKACPSSRKWFQLFPNSEKEVTIDLLHRAERAGFEALVLTVDAQKFGNKRIIIRNGLVLPPNVRVGNLVKYMGNWKKNVDSSASYSKGSSSKSVDDVNDVAGHAARTLAQDISWDIIPFLRRNTKMPLIIKGILTPEDAEIALKYKVNGIWISNHGGRQVDTVASPIDVLQAISKVVQGQCEIYIDSGVRRGTDAFKALALGATMVFVGRPQIWGNAVAGEKGATEVLKILKEELDMAMALSGVSDVNNITKEYVCRSELNAKL